MKFLKTLNLATLNIAHKKIEIFYEGRGDTFKNYKNKIAKVTQIKCFICNKKQ